MGYWDDMIKSGFASEGLLVRKRRLSQAYNSAVDTIKFIGMGRFYLMRHQLDEICYAAEAEIWKEMDAISRERRGA